MAPVESSGALSYPLPEVGEAVQVLSKTKAEELASQGVEAEETWLDARVIDCEIGSPVKITVEYELDVGTAQKRLPIDSPNWRRLGPPMTDGAPRSGAETDGSPRRHGDGDSEVASGDSPGSHTASEPNDGPGSHTDASDGDGSDGDGSDGHAAGAPPGAMRRPSQAPAPVAGASKRLSLVAPRGVGTADTRRATSLQGWQGAPPAPGATVDDGRRRVGDSRFLLREEIGRGAFSCVCLAEDTTGGGRQVAMKMERIEGCRYPQLEQEVQRYRRLQGGPGIPELIWHGADGEHRLMAMQLLGPSVEDFFERNSRRCTLGTVAHLAAQMLRSVAYMHSKGYLHRDLKPQNFCFGGPIESGQIYCLDFGLSKRFRRHGEHNKMRTGLRFVGTLRYASLAAQLGYEQCRADDCRALGYVIAYLAKGSLPWQGLKCASKEERRARTLEMKQSIPTSQLCAGLPDRYSNYIDYCNDLAFEEEPEYEYLRGILTGDAADDRAAMDGKTVFPNTAKPRASIAA